MARHVSLSAFRPSVAWWTAACLFAGLASAGAAVLVIGNSKAHDCYIAAKSRVDTRVGLATCSEALDDGGMSAKDIAATHVNRGVLLDMFGRYDESLSDFERGISYNPELGDGYLNRGVALTRLKHFDDALADLQKAMALGVTEPAIAYYDLGVVQEDMGRITDAYYSYKHALEIAPGFVPVTEALKHFVVTRKPRTAAPGSGT